MNLKYARRSEDTEQIRVIAWANANINTFPELKWLYHIPNGGKRGMQEAIKFKQMGIKPGVSDLCLPYRKGKYIGLFIELKYDNGRASKEQKAFLKDMVKAGHMAAVCYGADAAITLIEQYCFYDDTGCIDLREFEVTDEAGVLTVR